MTENPIFEGEPKLDAADPDSTPIRDRRVVTQPYDLVVGTLMNQIEEKTLHLRPLSDRPSFQRRYVWKNPIASRLIESILLNVPIPPVYLSQNAAFELDVIDGQQRIFSVYRFIKNQFNLSGLEVLSDLNGSQYFELPTAEQRKIATHVLRCVIITNDSHPEIKFDVFERLNTNTVPLNSQEIRNCIHRGPLVSLLGDLATYGPWLKILGRKNPDSRMRDEEMILRFMAFQLEGVGSYRTPQKRWLNKVAQDGQSFEPDQVERLAGLWKETVDKSLLLFKPEECFRSQGAKSRVVNRALMDLTMDMVSKMEPDQLRQNRTAIRARIRKVVKQEEFGDLISRAVDHKSRTLRRFELWDELVVSGLDA